MIWDAQGLPVRWVEDSDGDGVTDREEVYVVRLDGDGRVAELDICPDDACASGETTFFSYDEGTGRIVAAETRSIANGEPTRSDSFWVWVDHPLGHGLRAQRFSFYPDDGELLRGAPCTVAWTVEELRKYCPQHYETTIAFEGYVYPPLQSAD